MTAAILAAFFHYLGFMLMAGGITTQLYLLKLKPSVDTIGAISRSDLIYGLGAVVVFLSGFARINLGGKGFPYYLHNWAFHLAATLFVLTALLSIVPTLRYRRWRNAGVAVPEAWASTRKFVHIQLTAILVIALMMAMMAKGAGVIG